MLALLSAGPVLDAAPPAGAVDIGCSAVALVNAIDVANSNSDVSTIDLPAGCTYTFSGPNNFWYGPTALPPIASSIIVNGNGATIERAAGATQPTRLFFVGADPASARTTGSRRRAPAA